ncbi:MAG: ATP-binding protein [Rhodocyclaceae bacterium]|nr:ATP-binding protein [Rhodocyclaceae bacterium]
MSLVAGGVVEIIPASRDLPRFQRGWRVVAPVAAWLLGLPYADERLDGCVEAADRHPPLPAQFDEEWLGPALAPCVDGLRQEGPTPPLLLTAASAADAALAGRQLLTRADRPYHCLDLLALRAAPDPTGVLAALTLMQRIQGSAILAAPLDALADADGRPLEALALRLKTYTLRAPSVILAGGRGETWRRALGDLNTREIDLPEPDPGQRAALWRGLLDATDLEAKAIDALADRFVLGPARILGAAARATDAARLAGRTQPNAEDLNHAARITSLQSAGGTTCRIDTPFDLDDLVLPVKVKQRLRDVLSAIELRGRVLDEWGFARRVGGGRGIKVMFAGPSGTGKTMAAGILARSLQLDLQRIELAAVVSKYIGETEKNLDRAFAAARTANALLFIDEADALFGKRSEVKDAHDRYANVEIAYLLQKMEDHDGVVILATNLARNIDDAFSRRMQFVVEFPTPDVASRERLWRRMFPPEAPVQRDIDFNFLAKQFELAGGDIRNIALDAAFRAAQEEGSIDLKQVLKAIAREQVKRGKAPSMEEFREHFEQLREAHGSL